MLAKLVLVMLLGAAIEARAADTVAGEYQVKGAFLINFAKFVEWPAQTFKNPADPIVICVLGENPFGPGLEKAAQSTVVAKRPVTVLQLADGQQAGQCQIAFVAASERKLSKALLEAAQDASVLTVGESDGFIANGGVIGFKLEGERIRIAINTAAADRAKLHISAKLLSLAQAGRR
jgi:hypothetical protein